MVIVIHVQKNPCSKHIELWEMGPNPYGMTRHSPANVPLCTKTIDINANGTVVPPMATLNIPYAYLFDMPNPNGTPVIFATADLLLCATRVSAAAA